MALYCQPAWLHLMERLEKYDGDRQNPTRLLRLWTRIESLMIGKSLTLSDKEKNVVIVQIKNFLSNENIEVVEKVANVLIQIIQDTTSHPSQDVVIALMIKVKIKLTTPSAISTMEPLCEILMNLLSSCQENQNLLADTGCLEGLLRHFTMHLEDSCSVYPLPHIVNVLIHASCDPTNDFIKKKILNAVVPMILAYGIRWSKDSDPSPDSGFKLKECLFLCKEIMSVSEECKVIFLQKNGLQMLIQSLGELARMEEHIDLCLTHTTRPLYIDICPTLFSSFVLLLDEAIVDCIDGKIRALGLNAVNVLECYLDIAHGKQLGFVITCLVHLIENDEEENWNLVLRMKNLAQKSDLHLRPDAIEFLEQANSTISRKSLQRKGTPHPNKSHGACVKRKGTPHPNKSHGVCVQRKVTPHPKKSQCVPVKKLCVVPSPTTQLVKSNMHHNYFVTKAELMIFLSCVQTHGNNMVAVRKAFPFHPSMTPGDLYALWRAMWKSKRSFRKH